MKRRGFTILELIFVIVIIGILAGIALPHLGSTVNTAEIVKAKSEIAAIRNGINSKMNTSILADNASCPVLEGSNTELYFDNVTKGIKPIDNGIKWTEVNTTTYILTVDNESTTFTYDNNINNKCSFTCSSTDKLCKELND